MSNVNKQKTESTFSIRRRKEYTSRPLKTGANKHLWCKGYFVAFDTTPEHSRVITISRHSRGTVGVSTSGSNGRQSRPHSHCVFPVSTLIQRASCLPLEKNDGKQTKAASSILVVQTGHPSITTASEHRRKAPKTALLLVLTEKSKKAVKENTKGHAPRNKMWSVLRLLDSIVSTISSTQLWIDLRIKSLLPCHL